MKLLTEELRQFKKNASGITSTSILPISSYLKFENGYVTKHAETSYVRQEITCDETFLIDEKILMGFVASTNAKEIDVRVTDKSVFLSDGTGTAKSPTEDHTKYSKINLDGVDKVEIPDETLMSIVSASSFTLDELIPTFKSFVFVGRGYACAMNGAIYFADRVSNDVPDLVISKQIASFLAKHTGVSLMETDNFYHFDCGICQYGFSKREIQFFDFLSKQANPDLSRLPSFKINKGDMLAFNEMCATTYNAKVITKDKLYPVVSFRMDNSMFGDELCLEFGLKEYEIFFDRKVKVDGSCPEQFKYNPAYMNIILKSFSEETLTFYKGKDMYYIQGESDTITLIAKIS